MEKAVVKIEEINKFTDTLIATYGTRISNDIQSRIRSADSALAHLRLLGDSINSKAWQSAIIRYRTNVRSLFQLSENINLNTPAFTSLLHDLNESKNVLDSLISRRKK